MSDVVTALEKYRLLPVVVIPHAAQSDRLADALLTGGLPLAEITLRTDAALDAIEKIAQRPELVVGAGTVLTAEQVDQAVAAGARFLVSPGIRPAVVERARDADVLAIPGISTASELMLAIELGVDVVKFFPAETSGGAAAVAALSAPFADVRFVPTGGIGPDQVDSYLRLPSVLAVGGSWMVPRRAVEDGDVDEIARLAGAAVATITERTQRA